MTIDPITHGLIGAALATLSGHPMQLNDPVFLGCTLGAMLPDLDIVTHLKGRINYLLKHRGASHSFVALSGMALGLGSLVYTFFPSTPWTNVVFWTLIGTLSHGLADLLNSFGAQLLWPFYKKKFTFNMIMLTDPVVFAMFLISLIVSLFSPNLAKESTITAFMISSSYLVYREFDRRRTRKKLMERYNLKLKENIKVLPAMYRPFNWAFLIFEDERVRFGTIEGGEAKVLRTLPRWNVDDPCITNALEGELAEIFTQFTPYFHVLRKEDGADLKVEFMDLRYWDKEDFLYTGEVKMLPDGKIAEEKFYPFGNRNSQGILLEY
jgi:inner membrane protein